MTRAAKHGFCPRCRRHTIAGDDDDALALPALADFVALTHRGELLAVVDGRTTYHLDDGRLYRRDRWQLHRPADPVLPQHRCDQPVPVAWRQPIAPDPARPEDDPEEAPF